MFRVICSGVWLLCLMFMLIFVDAVQSAFSGFSFVRLFL